MASWHEPQYEPVRAARLAWERSQPQLFFEIHSTDAGTITPCAPGHPSHGRNEPLVVVSSGEGRPASAPPQTNGRGGTSIPGRAASASQE